MKQFKKLSRFTAAFLSLLTAFSIVPTAAITASAQTIYTTNASLTDTSITKNVYLDALGYLGFNVTSDKMFDSSGNLGNWYHSYREQLNTESIGYDYDYDYGTEGIEETNGKPNVSFFESNDMCCASYVSYVLFNYMKNIKGVDLIQKGVLKAPSSYQTVSSWRTMLDNQVASGEIKDVTKSTLEIGDILIFGENGHIAIYAGYKNGHNWMTHCGGDPGPTLDPIKLNGYQLYIDVGESGTGVLREAYRLPTEPFQQFGGISVKKVDKDTGEALEGAIFEVKDSNGNWVADLGPTDVNGCAETKKNLKPGTYTVTETQAPPNYELSSQSQTVTVVADTITPCHHIAVNTHRLIVCREHVRK